MSLRLPDGEQLQVLAAQPAFRFFALLLILQVTLAPLLQSASVPFGLAFSEAFFFAAPVALWSLGANWKPSTMLRLARPRAGLVLLGLAIGAANFLVAGSVQVAVRRLLPAEWARQFDVSHLFREIPPLDLALTLVAVGLFAPICEEIIFRGYLLTVFSARWRQRAAVAVCAVLFAALHFDPVGLLSRIELGVLFGVLALWSGSIWPAVAAHLANNAIASGLFVALARSGKADLAQPDPGMLPTLAAGATAAAVTLWLLSIFRAQAARAPSPPPPEAAEPGAGHDFAFGRARRGLAMTGVAAALSLGLFLAADWRGAAANWADHASPLREPMAVLQDRSAQRALEARLRAAKAQVRSGRASLEAYRRLRREVAGALADEKEASREVGMAEAFSKFGGSPPTGAGPLPDAALLPDAGPVPDAVPLPDSGPHPADKP